MPRLESDGIRLESQDGIARLLLMWSPARGKGRRAAEPAAAERAASRREQARLTDEPTQTARLRSGRCSCGVCRRCVDNARWERIFNERFADPTYYGRTTIRHHSSLAGL